MSYTTLLLQLNKSCNLRCPNCLWVLKSDDFFTNAEMSVNDAKKVIDYYVSHGVKRVMLQSEGEVLLYKGYQELVLYCKEKRVPMPILITNGVILDRYTDFILGHVPNVLVSIDGHTYGEYSKVRGGSEKSFNRILNGVSNFVVQRNMKKLGSTISINCVLTKDNIMNMIGMIDLAKHLGVDELRFRNFHPVFGGNGKKPLYTSDKEVLQAVKNAEKHAKQVGMTAVMPVLYQDGGVRFSCNGMLKDTIVIGCDGSFALCCHLEADGNYGNFFKDPTAFQTDPAKQNFVKRLYKAKNYDAIPDECKDCPRLKKGF